MKIIVTHASPDWDAISSAWFLKRFLPGWESAQVQFVPAGQRIAPFTGDSAIEKIGDNSVIHVDTGLGPLDHHQTSSKNVSAASLSWQFVQEHNKDLANPSSEKMQDRIESIERIVKILVEIDHFGEVFWDNPSADYHEFSLLGVLEGLKVEKPNQDMYYVEFGFTCLDALLHAFENRVWAEKEIRNGLEFTTSFGKGIAFETLNDTVMKLSQKLGYVIAVRKDPRKGYVRIKAKPGDENGKGIDLTLCYEQLSKMDPHATWFLHVSRKMLLNGTPKNPKMIPTTLTLKQIVDVVKAI